jgi:hypothetical protein
MVGTEQEALRHAIFECATQGREWEIQNSDREVVWSIEADTPVDDDAMVRPVIVHLRGGTLTDESIAILVEVVAK